MAQDAKGWQEGISLGAGAVAPSLVNTNIEQRKSEKERSDCFNLRLPNVESSRFAAM
jgi:hypothetical protein